MAVPDQIPVSSHIGNGVSTVYAYQFLLIDAADIGVAVDGAVLTLGIDYTVTGLRNPSGGTVAFSVAPVSESEIVLERDIPLTRTTDYQYSGDFQSPTVNDDFDRLWMAMQGSMLRAFRSLYFPFGERTDGRLPSIAERAGKLLTFDSLGKPLMVAPAPQSATALQIDLYDDLDPLKGAGMVANTVVRVGTMAELRARPAPTRKTVAFLEGFYSPGDGGGGMLVWMGTSAKADNGGTIIVPESAPANGRWERGGDIDVRWFGAVGDGAADDRPALLKAIAAAANQRLHIREGRYKIVESLTISTPIDILMAPGAVIDYSGAPAGAGLGVQRAFEVIGQIASPVSVTANVQRADAQVQVTSTATLAAGDAIVLRSDEQFMAGVVGSPVQRGHITRIKSIDSGTLFTLDERTPFSYASGSNARIEKITPVRDVTISGGMVIGGGVGKVHNGVYAYATENLRVHGVTIQDMEDCGVQTRYSINALVDKCVIEDSTSNAGIGNTGYGVCFFDGTRDSSIVGNTFRRCRHAVAGGSQIISLYCTVSGNVANDSSNHAYDCHEPCFWWAFTGNRATGGSGGLVIRGQHTLVQANVIANMTSSAIRVRSFYDNMEGLSGTQVLDNEISYCEGGGILIEGTSINNRVGFTNVRGNQVRFCGQDSIIIFYGINVSVKGNQVRSVAGFTGTGGSTIRVVGAATGDNVNIDISDNVLDRPLRHGINAQWVTGLKMDGNVISRVGVSPMGSPFFLVGCQRVSIAGGQGVADLVGNGPPISLDRCSRVTIGGGIVLQGNPSNTAQDGIRAFSAAGTMPTLIVSNAIVAGCGRNAINTTDYDRVVVTSSDLRDVSHATKISIVGATTQVTADNIT